MQREGPTEYLLSVSGPGAAERVLRLEDDVVRVGQRLLDVVRGAGKEKRRWEGKVRREVRRQRPLACLRSVLTQRRKCQRRQSRRESSEVPLFSCLCF